MGEVRIVYFLEDIAQERFIKVLVKRIATEESFSPFSLRHDMLSSGGGSRVVRDFENFVSDARRRKLPQNILDADIVIVAVDGNCQGPSERAKLLNKSVGSANYLYGKLVYAIPDPHIERWYLLDPKALSVSIGATGFPTPAYKCKKDYYKRCLKEAVQKAGIRSLLGGIEFAEPIAESMDLSRAAQQDKGFELFISDLKKRLMEIRRLHP